MIQEEFQDLEGTVESLRLKGNRCSWQSAVALVSGGGSRIPKQEQLPNDNYRANATFKVYLKKILPRPAGVPTGSFQS